jgi:hypothetical protein
MTEKVARCLQSLVPGEHAHILGVGNGVGCECEAAVLVSGS